MIFQSFPASSPCFLYQTFCFFVAISLFFRFFLIVLCRKRSKYLAFFPKNTTFASANLSKTWLSRTCSSVGQSNRLIIWRSLVQAQAGPHQKSSSYDKIVAAFSFYRKTMGKHIDFENSLIFQYTWHHIIPSKACKQGFSEYQNNVGKQRFHKIT